MLTYVMLTGESPFLGDSKQETFLNIAQVNVRYPAELFQGISLLAVDFLRSLLIRDPRYPPGHHGRSHGAGGAVGPR